MSNPSGNLSLYYATRDGQSRRIAQRLAQRLTEAGLATTPVDLAAGDPTGDDLARERIVVLLAAVRYGKHLPEAERCLTTYGGLTSPPPLALGSVNLTARKPGKDTPEGNPYLRKWLKRHPGVRPALATAIAGRLDYRRYRWLDRQMIRLIMKITGGPTDPSASVEYTSWDAVDAFAAQIAERFRQPA